MDGLNPHGSIPAALHLAGANDGLRGDALKQGQGAVRLAADGGGGRTEKDGFCWRTVAGDEGGEFIHGVLLFWVVVNESDSQ